MFSSNNDNAHTASAFLQEKISSSTINKNIQVINAGISGSWSEQEVKLVKNKILDFEPDLLVVYDGYNDLYIVIHFNISFSTTFTYCN